MEYPDVFISTLLGLGATREGAQSEWEEVEKAYSEPHRRYHTLEHLEEMWQALGQALEPQPSPVHVMALAYHDFVYDPVRSDNEERSADAAATFLQRLGVSMPVQAACIAMILATKMHAATGNKDIDLFTDADLAILASPAERYVAYTQQIRQEYSAYPDAVYTAGRLNVIRHFLTKARIFKTEVFYLRAETAARENLRGEEATLQ